MTAEPPDRATALRRRWRAVIDPTGARAAENRFWSDVRSRHPKFLTAVTADVRVTAANRGDPYRVGSRRDTLVSALRLAIVSDSFFAQCCYRAKASCQASGIPVLPRLLHRLAMVTAQVCIGDPVVVQPGVYIPHGQVVVDGFVEIASGVVLFPFVTIGLQAGDIRGPKIGAHAAIGTGAKVIGPVRVGRRAKIGANAVVLSDVPDGATAVGVPARTIE